MTFIRMARFPGWLLLALVMPLAVLAVPSASFAQGIGVSITVAPPVLPVYAQPICPGDGYLWTPGYWGWDDGDYYWVPGTWALAPEPGFLWTPGYWGWSSGAYLWNAGYWGEHVGFYGGVDYGFGYVGTGFAGGYWQGGSFFYNTSVMNVNTTIIHNTFNKTVIRNTSGNRVSFNGGTGGIKARPTAEQARYASERHIAATAEQTRHQEAAAGDRSLRASVNHGKPPVAATARPGDFKSGVVAARGGNAGRSSSTRTARTESKASKPATTEHANARHTEAKPAPSHQEHAAKSEAKAPKPAKSDHVNTHAEAKPAPSHEEHAAKSETKAPKPAKSEHVNTRAEAKPAPTKRASAHVEAEPAPDHHEAAAHAESASKPEHESAPHPESKPAPAEKKPPR